MSAQDRSSNAIHRYKRRKAVLLLIVFLGILLLPLLQASLREDISAMLPRGKNGRIIKDFQLLQKAPLSGRILITISSPNAVPQQLAETADTFCTMLDSSMIRLQSYGDISPQEIISFLLANRASLSTSEDIHKLDKLVQPEQITESLTAMKRQLLSPAGMGMKTVFLQDPLDTRSVYLSKLQSLKNLPSFSFTDKYILNKDRTAVLLIAETDIPMTDSRNGELLLNHFSKVKQQTLLQHGARIPGLEIQMLSGHIYTVSNAGTIKRDILTVSAISACALLLLFAISFRRKEALSVFLAPGIAIVAGLGSATFFFPDLSAIVIGFGAVLMGISIDFAVHTWFALSEYPENPQQAIRKVSAPVLFGTATSCAAFAALFISGIPGIKQLAVFASTGIIAACAYALLFLPCFGSAGTAHIPAPAPRPAMRYPKLAGLLTLLVLSLATTAAFSNSFDTELKNLGFISRQVSSTEKHFHEKWGNLRGQSLLFATGTDTDEALRNNEKVWADLNENLPQIPKVSIAPVLPSTDVQQANRQRWDKFWQPERISAATISVDRAAAELGFTPHIFRDSITSLTKTVSPLTIRELQDSPLAFLTEIFIPAKDSGPDLILTLLPDTSEVSDYFTQGKEKQLGARLVSQSRFKSALEKEMKTDIIRFICLSGLLVLVLSIVLFHNPRRALLAIFPAVFGVITTFGLLGICAIQLNIFHIVALPLVIGLGADYGIFMVFQEIRKPSASTVRAVRISGLTTLAGFGVLIFARHPSLHSLGATVAIGVSASLACALLILPHFLQIKEELPNR